MGSETLFVILCKPPSSPDTKTRLAETTSRRIATALYQQCLVHVLTAVAAMDGYMRVSVDGSPLELAPLCLAIASDVEIELVRQRGSSFAERQAREIGRALYEGFSSIVLVASDLPALSQDALEWVSAVARSGRVGLVPSPDGGYSLLGTSQPLPEITRVPMSQNDTCDALARAVQDAGKPVNVADFTVSDLDRIEDLASHRRWSATGEQWYERRAR